MLTKYGVILADPPWYWRAYSAKGEGRGAVNHYDCLSLDGLMAMRGQIDEYAAADCALFLWAIDPMLPEALALIDAWGFRYKTVGFYWVKTNRKSPGFSTGLGYWTRANPEQCLFATRGAPVRLARDVSRLLVAPRREHSRKPDEVYPAIERLVAGPYLELFARTRRAGWDCCGDQVGWWTDDQTHGGLTDAV